ncbi:hypothetical protein PR202_gb04555 [Eleusine coracana subsp. coracana]|uniref:Katanin p80 WD40 repeat-containing subunit B1 homolog n=1 Tax=Eleusine coracana subsp. coracana TaxID=191504 RepID=A0AAV5E385_ELECO|nr:hypothetical protein PR202_gb04555 [Eleusine coracana subsp. coracana]
MQNQGSPRTITVLPIWKCALLKFDISLTRHPKIEEFVAHDAEVRSLSIGKKSSRVFITGGSDRKVNLWAIGKQTPLLVFSWEPVRCHDVVDMGWTNMADLSIYEGKLLGCSYHERCVGLWAADISLIGPYALGVLPKTNFFAELVHSIDDPPVKSIDSTANSSPALATSHPKSSFKVKELGIAESRVRGLRLTPSSTDKIKKDRSSNIGRRPDSSFKSSVQGATPMRRMKVADSPSTNPRTVERNSGQRDISLASRARISNNSSTTKKGHFTESAPVKDIYTTSQAISAPVVVPRDILEDKTVGNFCRGTTAVPDDFRNPAHRRKFSLGADASDSDTSVTSTPPKSDVCSEGLSGFKFSFGLTPYHKREEYDNVDKGHITQMAEHMDRAMSLEHPVQSSNDKSIHGQAQTNQTYDKDLSTVDEAMTPINLTQNHDEFINNLKLRLTKLEVTPSVTSLQT